MSDFKLKTTTKEELQEKLILAILLEESERNLSILFKKIEEE